MGKSLALLAVAILAALAGGAGGNATIPKITLPVVSCGNTDILFVVNLRSVDAQNMTVFRQTLLGFQTRAEALINSGVGVGIITFSSKVVRALAITRDVEALRAAVLRIMETPPDNDGAATGDALVAARSVWLAHKEQLKQLGLKRKLVTIVGAASDRTVGQPTAGTAVELWRCSDAVFAVNLGGGVSLAELNRIASGGSRTIFDADDLLDIMSKIVGMANVYCPCPFSWEIRQNCTVQGVAEITRFSYERSQQEPFNCIRQSAVDNVTCDCPPNRVERSPCENNTITLTTVEYTRPDNNSLCIETTTVATEACGRASGCEAIVCPPGANCSESSGSVVCSCTNTSDVFSTRGCTECDTLDPQVSRGPCLNGVREVRSVTFQKVNDTQCLAQVATISETCQICPTNNTATVGPCVRGYEQVTQVRYQARADGRCYKTLRKFHRQCRLSSEFECVGSVNYGGQFVTFDGQLVDFPGPCTYTLTKRTNQFEISVEQGIKFATLPFLTHVASVNVQIGNVRYQLTEKLRLMTVDGVQSLPYRDTATGVEVFYADDAIVLASADLYVQYRGASLTVSVSRRFSANGGLTGILGNCNGDISDDFISASGRDLQNEADRDTLLGQSFQLTNCVTTPCCPVPQRPTCGFNTSTQSTSLANCGMLAASSESAFSHCSGANVGAMLTACRNLFCAAEDNPAWQRALVCSVMEVAAFRCFLKVATTANNSYPIYRTQDFCPKQCGSNSEFVNNADFCPRTCARHFFNSDVGCATPFGYSRAKNFRGQTPIPGCQCSSGFVLDGDRCVRPNECECLSDLCINRENRTLCEQWRSEGRCRTNPLVMQKYCRLTCGMCDAVCRDQISSARCAEVKQRGECNDTFYNQMCQLTCNPAGCECPDCKVVRGPCDPVTLNRNVTRYCFSPDENGVCRMNATSETFEECGICQTERSAVVERSCDYCNETQILTTRITIRESDGQRRCLQETRTSSTRSPECACNGTTERNVCYRGCDLYRLATTFRPSGDCINCLRSVSETKIRTVTCPTTVVRGECDRNVTQRQPVTVTRGLVRNCACENATFRFEELCVCPPPRWTPAQCTLNKFFLRWHMSYHLRNGTCLVKAKRHVTKVPCPSRLKKKYVCVGDMKFRIKVWYARRHCVCTRMVSRKLIGACRCPPHSRNVTECTDNQKTITVTKFILEGNHCTRLSHSITVPCACQPTVNISRCDAETGVRTIGTTVFTRIDDTCQESHRTVEIPTVCQPQRVERRGDCRLLNEGDPVKYRRVTYVRERRVSGECRCMQLRRVKEEPCGCKHKIIKETRCPAHCPAVSSDCPRSCHRRRILYRLRYHYGECRREEVSRHTFPCCCQAPRKRPPKCVDNRYLVKCSFEARLKDGCCQQRKHVMKQDLAKTCDLTQMRHFRRGDLLIVQRRKLVNCRCVWQSRSRHCPNRCPASKKFSRCDPVSNERLVVRIWCHRRGCHCLSKRSVSREPVNCPEAKTRRWDLCDSKGYRLLHVVSYHAEDCKCRKRMWKKKLPCKAISCDSHPVEERHCDPSGHQMFKIVTYKMPFRGSCVQRLRRRRLPMGSCQGVRRRYRRCIDGNMVQFVQKSHFERCHCRMRVFRRVLSECDSYCSKRNSLSGNRVRRRCNPATNIITTEKLTWISDDNGVCRRRWRSVGTHAEPDCPPPKIRVSHCDAATGKQRVKTISYEMHRCRCRGPRVSVSYRSCACSGGKVIRKVCDPRQGCLVTTVLLSSWNNDIGACHARKVYRRVPIHCGHRGHEKHGSCVHGRMKFVRVKFIRDLRTCKCRRAMQTKLVDCRCRVIVRHARCQPGKAIAHTVFLFRKYDASQHRCVIVGRKRRYRRCSCPRGSKTKRCVDGKTVVTKISYVLDGRSCRRSKSSETYSVPCSHKTVIRTIACNANCVKKQIAMRYYVNPNTCKCQMKQVGVRRCRCCGCPRSDLKTTCQQEKFLRTQVTYYSIRANRCSEKCRQHTKVTTKRVRCHQPRKYGWGPCSSDCTSRQFVVFYKSVNCICTRKVRQLSKLRVCCCRGGAIVRRKCQRSSGLWQTITIRKALRDHRCVKASSVKYDPRPNCAMPDNPTSFGACNNSTCQQTVIRTENFLNKTICACQLKDKVVGQRACCCVNPEPTRTQVCVENNQLVRIVSTPTFNEVTRVCQAVETRSTETVTCGDGSTRVDAPPCTGSTRVVVTIRQVVQNCQCVDQVVERRTEACVCPNATEWTRFGCDSSTGSLIFRRTRFTLSSGQCVSSVEEERRAVTCSTTPRVDVVCDNTSCSETVTTTRQDLDVAACACKQRINIATRSCCCPTAVQTRRDCIDNEFFDIIIRQELEASTRTCQTRTQRTRSPIVVPCETETRRDLGCNSATRIRSIRVVRRALSNCVCQVSTRVTQSQTCACPPERVTRGDCDPTTCQRRVDTVSFIAVNNTDGSVNCTRAESRQLQTCCCTKAGERPVIVRRECDPETGDTLVTKSWKKFIAMTLTCRDVHKTKVKPLRCGPNYNQLDRDYRRGSCDLTTGLRRIVVVWYERDNQRCKCVRKEKVKQKVCSCKHLPNQRRRYCDRERNEIVRVHKYHVLRNGACVALQRLKRKQVPCPLARKVRQRCGSDCKHKKVITYSKLSNCECKRRKIVHRRLCCCPDAKFSKTCKGNRWKMTTVRYQLSDDKRSCNKDESSRYVPIKCRRRAIVKRSGCNRSTCWCTYVKLRYRAVKCRCVPRVSAKKRVRCCCPRPKTRVTCALGGRAHETKTVRYSLRDGHCIAKVTRRIRKVRCPRPRLIRKLPCDPHTGQRRFKFRIFKLHKCVCRRSYAIRTQICSCPPPRLVKTNCREGRRYRAVYQVTYYRAKGRSPRHGIEEEEKEEAQVDEESVGASRCLPKKKLLHKEPCRCPPPTQKRHCDPVDGQEMLLLSLTYRMTRAHGRRTCVQSHEVHRKPIHCAARSIRRGSCVRGVRKLAITKYEVHACRCVPRVRYARVRCYSPKHPRGSRCDASKGEIVTFATHEHPEPIHHYHHRSVEYLRRKYMKSHPQRVDHHRGTYIKRQHRRVVVDKKRREFNYHQYHRYRRSAVPDYDDQMQLEEEEHQREYRVQKRVHYVRCKTQKREMPLPGGCCVRRNGSLYRRIAVMCERRFGCKCRTIRRVRLQLCRCRRPRRSTQCLDNAIQHRYTLKFRHGAGGLCEPIRRKVTVVTKCRGRKVTVRKGRCDKLTCLRPVKLLLKRVHRCRCSRVKKVGHELCCAPHATKKVYCRRGRKHVVKTVHRLVKRRVLATDSRTGQKWLLLKVVKRHIRRSRRIRCPKPHVAESCDAHTGVKTKRVTVYRVVRCRCKPRMRTIRSKCRCPAPRRHVGRCYRGRRRCTKVYYVLDSNGECHRKRKSYFKRCGCPKRRRLVRCFDGYRRLCTVGYLRHSHCRPVRRCRKRIVRCPEAAVRRMGCNAATGKARIVRTIYTADKETCKCEKVTSVKLVDCNCRRKNMKKRKCRGNVLKTVTRKYTLQDGECVPATSVTHKKVLCPRSRTEVVGDTCITVPGLRKSGTQLAHLTWYKAVRCKCKRFTKTIRVPCLCSLIPRFKTRVHVRCDSDDILREKKTEYTLVGRRCKPRVTKVTKQIECNARPRETTSGCVQDPVGDRFRRVTTLRQVPRLCRCVWRKAGRVRINCGCRSPKRRSRCVNNNVQETTVINYRAPLRPSGSCEPFAVVRTSLVSCNATITRVMPCDNATLFQKVITIRQEALRCRCKPVKTVTKQRCGCPEARIGSEVCNSETNRFEQRSVRYQLVDGECQTILNVANRTVVCDTRNPRVTTGSCVNNRRARTTRTFRLVNCNCLATDRTVNEVCDCSGRRLELGTCNGTQQVTQDRFFRDVFNATSGQCTEVLDRQETRYCQCDTARVLSVTCVNENIIRRVTAVSQLVNNTCIESTRVDEQQIVCPSNVTTTTTRADCSPDFTRSVTRRNFVVSNCTCAVQESRNTEICNCFERNGGRQEARECRNDNVTVTTVSYFFDSSPGVCTERKFEIEDRVTCRGRKEEREKCSPDSPKREIRIFELVARNCQCTWRQLPSRFEACRCRKPRSRFVCHGDTKRLRVTKFYTIVNGRCVEKKKKSTQLIRCGKTLKKKYTECSRFSNKRWEITVVTKAERCLCRTRRIKRRCSCRCPSSRRWSVCRDNKIVTYITAYRLAGCSCVKHTICRHTAPPCNSKKQRLTRSTCLPGAGGDSFMTVVVEKRQLSGCRCKTVKRETKVACRCAPRQQQQRQCSGNNLKIRTTRRLLIGGACERKLVKTQLRTVACPITSMVAMSDCTPQGWRTMRKTVWRVRDCKCVPTVKMTRQSCNLKCDLPMRLKRRSHCDKETCDLRLHYVFKDAQCHPRYKTKTVKCCCPHPHRRRRRCLGRAYEVTKVFHQLKKGYCLSSTVIFRQAIKCPRRLTYKTTRLSNGRKVAMKVWYAVKQCKCRRQSMKLPYKHKAQCKPPRTKNSCVAGPEQRVRKTVVRYLRHKRSCSRRVDVTETPVSCPGEVTSRTGCEWQPEANAYVRTVKTARYSPINCHCRSSSRQRVEVCGCRQPRVRSRCLAEEGAVEVTTTSYQEATDGASCQPISSVRLLRVNCDSTWHPVGTKSPYHHRKRQHSEYFNDFYEDSPRYMKMQRLVRRGCSCKCEIRKLRCMADCPEMTARRVCEGGNKLFRVTSKYFKVDRCRCGVKVRKERLPVELPPGRVVDGRCNTGTCEKTIETVRFVVRDCKPKEVREKKTRKCCCQQPTVTRQCRLNNLEAFINISERLTADGRCDRIVTSKSRVVTCRGLISDKPVGRCMGGRRVYQRQLEKPVNCQCQMRTQRLSRRCGFKVCQASIINRGRCVNCKMQINTYDFVYNAKKRRCVKTKSHKSVKCCCPKTKYQRRCVKNHLVLFMTLFKYDSTSSRCLKRTVRKGISGMLWKKCKSKEKTVVGACMANGYRMVTIVHATMVNCKCVLSRSFRLERCRCDPPLSNRDCVRNGTTVYTRNVTQTLDGNTCRERIDENYNPVVCPEDSFTEGVCNDITCLRQTVTVNYTVSDCSCQRTVLQRQEVCCCPPSVNETRNCRRSDNTQIITRVSQEFNLETRACETRTTSATEAIICEPNRRRILGPCDILRNNSLYQVVTDSQTVASGCECVRQQQQTEVLCGCQQTEPQTICTEDNKLQTFQIIFRPNENSTVCEPSRVVLSERDIECDGTQRVTVPVCTTGTRSASGELRVNVQTSWLERGSNCTCTRRVRIEQRLCRCPDNPAPRLLCDKRTNRRVRVTTTYTLVNTTEPECVKSTVRQILPVERCPNPEVNVGKCQFGLAFVKTQVQMLSYCRCKPRMFKHFQRCSKRRVQCINKLPDRVCVDLDNKFQICTADLTNSTQALQAASQLCDKHCGRCDSCKAIGGKWRFQFAGRNCIVADRRYTSFHIADNKGFKFCRKMCKKDVNCRSFDFYLPSRVCSLARVDRSRLRDLIHPRSHVFGAGPSDLSHRNAEQCGLYERYCSRRVASHLERVQLGCPPPQVTKDAECTCTSVGLAAGKFRFCYKTVTVTYYSRSSNGECRKREAFVRTTCLSGAHCRDKMLKVKCRSVEQRGGCTVTETARNCQKTCGLCQCSGREFVKEGSCDLHTGKQKNTVYRTEYTKAFRLCRVKKMVVVEPCTACPIGRWHVATACTAGSRNIFMTKYALVDGKCLRKVSQRSVPCKKCYLGVHRALGPCAGGKRSVKTFYTERVGTDCKERQLQDKVACSGCPEPKIRSAACVRGKRLQRVTFYARHQHSHRCYALHYDTEQRCRPLCYDHRSPAECQYQLMTGQCKWNADTRQQCRRSCNLC